LYFDRSFDTVTSELSDTCGITYLKKIMFRELSEANSGAKVTASMTINFKVS
jgi:hypothetical protein